ncbi:hypothetical protein ABXW19_12225, partial [Streptococcus suis]|uniref:hypothetical protein n=1 Tax=Streptococcus suis TaxID=1307 RepID=UPI003CEA8114
ILQYAIKDQGPAAHLFQESYAYAVDYHYCGRKFNFGFLEVFEGGERALAQGSTTIPTFKVDNQSMQAIAPH